MADEIVNWDPCSERQVLDVLIRACETGRPIVPLLGAGISVDSGYPPTGAIVRYLAKAKYFLNEGRYRPPPYDEDDGKDDDLSYPRDRYLSVCGWPDPFELTDLLWAAGLTPKDVERWIRENYRDGWHHESPTELRRLEAMYGLLKRATTREREQFLNDSMGRPPIPDDQRREILEFWHSRITPPNWRSFLRWVTDSRADHVDNLFFMFNRGRARGSATGFWRSWHAWTVGSSS